MTRADHSVFQYSFGSSSESTVIARTFYLAMSALEHLMLMELVYLNTLRAPLVGAGCHALEIKLRDIGVRVLLQLLREGEEVFRLYLIIAGIALNEYP
jgi:hypothetical protein